MFFLRWSITELPELPIVDSIMVPQWVPHGPTWLSPHGPTVFRKLCIVELPEQLTVGQVVSVADGSEPLASQDLVLMWCGHRDRFRQTVTDGTAAPFSQSGAIGQLSAEYRAPWPLQCSASNEEIAILITGDSSARRSIVVQPCAHEGRGVMLQLISEIHRSWDPLHYVLMFLHSTVTWQPLSDRHQLAEQQMERHATIALLIAGL